MLKKLHFFAISAALIAALSACSSSDDSDEAKDKPYVKTSAWPILSEEQTLQVYYQDTYDYDENRDYHQDSFRIYFNQFKPQSNIEPDDDALDQTTNDLLFSETAWKDDTRIWETNPAIFNSPNAVYSKDRNYRVWQNAQLSAVIPSKNRPLHEAIDDDVFSIFLGTQFVWDLGKHPMAKETDVSGKKLERYETTDEGLPLLLNSSEWAKVERDKKIFSEGAKYYPLTLSVVTQSTVIEAVASGQNYSLAATDVVQNLADLNAFTTTYQEPNRFEYRFSNSPRDVDNRSVFISFDVGTQTAILSEQSTGPSLVSSLPFQLKDNQLLLEIDLQAVNNPDKAKLGFSGLFNPVVIGPITEDGDDHFYYGKRYIKTTEANRGQLPVLVLFNSIAVEDIKNTFKAFRQEKFDDQL